VDYQNKRNEWWNGWWHQLTKLLFITNFIFSFTVLRFAGSSSSKVLTWKHIDQQEIFTNQILCKIYTNQLKFRIWPFQFFV
jgi:hypothetical protein